MSKVAIITGALLSLLGIVFFVLASERSFTALIPLIFGVPIFGSGLVARDETKRKAAMHGAVFFGLLGFLGSLMGASKWPKLLAGQPVERPLAGWETLIMAIICGIFVVLCVRSFIAARRAR